jgi:phage-related minor tail protein
MREAEKALLGVGTSAGQTRAALAQLPAQFTDIGTSLAGGQNPFLVLIQQGGQIRDSFGGFGNALRGIGSLIKPTTIAFGGLGAAVAVITLAYAQGSKEQDAYARGLIMTGNASGQTVGSLNAMAVAISGIAGTQGKAAEALTALVGAGGVAGGALQKAAEAAIRLERVGGPAIEETVRQFSELGKEPLQAAVKLNERTGFLTTSIYQQIKALEDQGRVAEAARVAQLAYADALEGRTAQLEARLGTFERAWRALGDTAKGAWDKMLNIGRPETIEEAVAKAEASVAAAERRLAGGGRRGGTGSELRGGGTAADVAAAHALLDTQREGLKISRQLAESESGRTARVKALAETEQLVTNSLSSQQKLTKELEAARTRMELAGRDPKEIETALGAITQGSTAFQQAIEAQLATLRNAASEMVRAAAACCPRSSTSSSRATRR